MRVAATLALLLVLATPGHAFCRLALTLAMDVSSSIDGEEHALQKLGLDAALSDPRVVEAFFQVPGGSVALHVFEWSGRYQQDVILDWTLVETPADLARVRAVLRGARRTYAEFPTALGHAIAFATSELKRGPRCDRQTIDISGDGVNNDGFPPIQARRSQDLANTTINALVIGSQPELMNYFRTGVIHGPGAFVEQADTFHDFGHAMRRKLIRELGVPRLGMR
ncbi:DUF1194 domain-containing protein [Oceanibium sediminis]|uniref:DUF1194 domain-containing protein n=1 Tax=Oceanibium sediminis TaxID=2026339 RepID=UPI001E60B24E|nr:DUF1194 domain-containing protein [Oceanibium sediminis]